MYVHYGHNSFDVNLFNPICNISFFTKPAGGLWASRADAKYGWKEWCQENNFEDCNFSKSFRFSLKENARVLEIRSHETFLCVFNLYGREKGGRLTSFQLLDYEKLAKYYDAVEFFLSEDGRLYRDMYGWDCDSLLVMNPEMIKEEK